MSKFLNDNFRINKGAPADDRELNGTVTYVDVAEALATIVLSRRYLTLTVGIGTPAVEYWFRAGIADGDLVVKTTAAVLDEAPTEAFNANLTFNVFPSKDIQSFNLAGGDLVLTVNAAGNKRHASIAFKVIADGVHSITFSGPRWDANGRYNIVSGEILKAGTYLVYLLYSDDGAQVSIPGNVKGVYRGTWNFPAAADPSWSEGDWGFATASRGTQDDANYVSSGQIIFKTPAGFRYV